MILGFAGLILLVLPESKAQAGLLKNGVKPGDRSKMHIVRPPSAGQRRRIFAPGTRNMQAAPKPGAKGAARQRHAWFWRAHSPALNAADPARWAQALATMTERRAKGEQTVSTQAVATIASTYRREIAAAAARHTVSEALLTAVIAVESAGWPQAVSPKNARGLMQLIPATAKRFGVTDSFDAGQNIMGGAAYLNWLLREFRGDALLALAGYNAGEGAVRKHSGVPPFVETRDYVVKVMDAAAAAQRLCPVPLTGPRVRCDLSGTGS